MDAVLTLSEGIGLEAAKVFYKDSLFCGTSGSAACLSCHPSCTSCTGGICDSCKDSNAVKAGGGAFCHCAGSWGWGTSSYHENCSNCNGECQTCERASDFQSCTSCTATGATPDQISIGSCVCGNGYITLTSSPLVCVPCHASCKTCVDSTPSGCISCKLAGSSGGDPNGGSCACDSGYAPQNPVTVDCVACHPSCLICVDGTADGCQSCLFTGAALSSPSLGRCSCGNGFVPQDPATSACVKCHSSCQTCIDGTSNGCKTCKVAEATLSNASGGTCSCGSTYVSQSPATEACVSCHFTCQTCINGTNAGCKTCKVATVPVSNPDGGYCACGDGFVPQEPVVGPCVPCHASCATCVDNTFTGCKSCKFAGTSLSAPSGGSCSCGSQFAPQSPVTVACVPCHVSCKTCSDGTPEGCKSCSFADTTLSNPNGGHCSCGSNFAPQSPVTIACVPCHSSCQTCANGTHSGCKSCKVATATLDNALGGTCFCGPTYVPQSPAISACIPCYPSCQTCVVDSIMGCKSCKVATAILSGLDGGFCSCGDGFVPQEPVLNACVPCHTSCLTCVDNASTGCTSCKFANTLLSNLSGGICSCKADYVPQSPMTHACVPCHPSCSTCKTETASGCLTCKIATAVVTDVTGGMCYCPDGFMVQESPVTECVPCHPSCRRCINELIGGCLSCKAAGAKPTKFVGGSCNCGDGYVPQEGVTGSCVPCAGCRFCSGPRAPQCMANRDMAVFGVLTDSNYGLPMSKVANGAVCYGSKLPSSPKDLRVFEGILGALTSDGPVATDKCYELLQLQWPSLIYWFNMLIPNFTPPSEATEFQIYSIKTAVWLWVLRFGSTVLSFDSSWKQLISALNAPQSQWYKYLAWGGATPGYTIDGKTVRNFPVAMGAVSSGELAVLNLFSKVCQTFGCAMKVQCQQVAVSSPCTSVA